MGNTKYYYSEFGGFCRTGVEVEDAANGAKLRGFYLENLANVLFICRSNIL